MDILAKILIVLGIILLFQFFHYLQAGSFEEYVNVIKSVGLKGFLKMLLRLTIVSGILFLLFKFT